MLTAPPRKDEAGTIAALQDLDVLDSGPEAEFDALVRVATLVCGTPVSLISLVDSERQWFKANIGLPGVSETPRDQAFCAHAVLGEGLFEVSDASQDPRFADNPLVTGKPDIRFYAGAPVRLRDGHAVGTLCVIDRQPRQLNEQQREVMLKLADAVAHALEGRRALRAEHAVLGEAARAAVVLQHSADAVVSLSPDGLIQEMNRSAERLLGYPAHELIGKPYATVVPEDLQRLHQNTMQNLAAAGHAMSQESRRLRRDGVVVHVAATWVPELDAGGRLLSATDFLRDISAQVESAKELAVSAARFRSLSDCAPVGVYHSDAAGRCTYTNTHLQEIYGLNLQQTLGVGWLRAVHADDREAVQRQLDRVHQSDADFEMEFRIQRVSDGALRWARSHGREVRGRDGELQGFVGTIEDVTDARELQATLLSERERAEAAAQSASAQARFVRAIADALPGLVAYWGRDLQCRFASRSYEHWFGRKPEEIIGTSMQDLLGERVFKLNEPYVRAVLAGQAQTFERNLTKPDGSVGHTLAHYTPDITPAGEVIGFFVMVTDVTRVQQAESELLLAASVFHSTVDGIAVIDSDGMILSVNPAFGHITGYASEEAVGQHLKTVMPDLVAPAVQQAIEAALKENGRWAGEVWNRRRNGDAFLQWQTVTVVAGLDDDASRLVYVFNDITERRQLDAQLHHLAFHDPLTDLPNRSLLMERANQLIQMRSREQRRLAMMYLDLDGFKAINDQLGHTAGDSLLKQVAARLLRQVRQSDTVARLGGDEFVLLLDNPVGLEVLKGIADRTIDTIRAITELAGSPMRIGVSIGIALLEAPGETAADLLRRADEAMYRAKADGKNRYCFYAPAEAVHRQEPTRP